MSLAVKASGVADCRKNPQPVSTVVSDIVCDVQILHHRGFGGLICELVIRGLFPSKIDRDINLLILQVEARHSLIGKS